MSQNLMPEAMIERVARRFKILSEPIRLELLNLMQVNGAMSVQALVNASGHRQANVSKHLGLLSREGILSRRKEGLNVFYNIDDPSIQGLCLLVCGQIRSNLTADQDLLEI